MTAAILQPVFGLTVQMVWTQIKTGLIAVVVQIVIVPIIVIKNTEKDKQQRSP